MNRGSLGTTLEFSEFTSISILLLLFLILFILFILISFSFETVLIPTGTRGDLQEMRFRVERINRDSI